MLDEMGARPNVKDDETGSSPPVDRHSPESRDSAPRRTYLAAERTYLAWLRTGLGALGLGLAVGRLVPALIESSHLAFGLLGAGYGLLGAFLVVFAGWRQRRITRALTSGGQMPFDDWIVTLLTFAGLALAIATIALVVVQI